MARRPLVLSLLAALALLSPPLAAAQTAPPPAEDDDTEARTLDTVVVTGTRSQTRTVAESLSPIDVIGGQELENAGTPELQSVLARLVPSFNFPRTSITDGSDHVRPAQLRGLSPDQTLVLVNGKRRHRTAIVNVNGTVGRGSSPVDLNAIPVSAIKAIEVLRDGAAAQYGTDAIAGVINIILKNADEGGEVDVRVGETSEGDGELAQGAVNVGLNLAGDGFLNLTAEYRDKNFTNRSTPDRRQQYPLVGGQPDPREATFDRINHRFGDAATIDRALFFNGEMPLTEAVALYAFGGWSARDGESAGFYRRALDARNVPAIYPDGFLPLIVSNVSDMSLVAGLRGQFGAGWDWDLSLNTGGQEFDFFVENSLNRALGASSPRDFYAGTLDYRQNAVNLDFNRAFDVGWMSGPLNLAFGAESREEKFVLAAGEPASYIGGALGQPPGAQVFPGFRPSDEADASRDMWALYADLEGNLTERFSLGLAGRHEDYSDFGSTTSGKLSARFAFTQHWALRGTFSNGFRAPNLQQQFYSTTATNFISGVPFDIRTFPVSSPVAQALGAEPLQPEESRNLSFGLVAQPLDTLNFTLDFYRIDIDDRIVLSENLTGTAITNYLASQGFPGVTGGRYFTNAIDTRTEGVDFVGRWTPPLGDAGNFSLTLGYNHNDTEVTRIAPNPPQLQAIDPNLVRFGRVELGRLTVGSPRDKWVLGGDYGIGAFSASLTATRYGEWQVLGAPLSGGLPPVDDTFGPDWVVDLALNYRWDRVTFTLGAENLFDQYPDEVTTRLATDANGFVSSLPGDNSNTGILPYPRDSAPYGFNGRFVYARVNYRW
ncbi:TonB-dependent receptor plug domain-containing protein [Lysobacter cavernae]|uniref:TonB-dependent receptor plug domain-containing protein n=1 Tax=Lysobacter cavernae TaxID=1685901 RepID=A0ABV7RKW9_9GAMM